MKVPDIIYQKKTKLTLIWMLKDVVAILELEQNLFFAECLLVSFVSIFI